MITATQPGIALTRIATGHWASRVLDAAVTLDIFGAIARSGHQGHTAEGVALACDTDARTTGALLDALAGLDLLTKSTDRYRLPDELAPYLDPTGARSMIPALAFNASMGKVWLGLEQTIRTGKPAAPTDGHLGGDGGFTRQFVRAMASRASLIADDVVESCDMTDHTRLLDLGSGPGVFSRSMLHQHDGLHVTLLDLPPILAEVEQLISESADPADRIALHPGDYRQDALPTAHDAILYAGALHQESTNSATALFGKCLNALPPGGVLHVIDLMLDPDGARPAFSGLFQLNMMLLSPIARVFRLDETIALLQDAGFTDVTGEWLNDLGYAAVVAHRPD